MGILAAAILGIGTAFQIGGNISRAQAQARADKRRAQQLAELSKVGGYYDQQLKALDVEFKNIEAEREANFQIRAISTLGVTEQGIAAKADIAAASGVSGFAAEGSILRRGERIDISVEREVAKIQLQFENVQRGLASQEAQATAQQTLVEFNKRTGSQQAADLRSEANWLSSWGVFFGAATPVIDLAREFDWGSIMSGKRNAD